MKRIYLFSLLIIILLSGSNAAALTVSNATFYTDNFGWNPFGWAEGHFLEFGANIDSLTTITSANATSYDSGWVEPLTYDGGSLYWGSAPVTPGITDYGTLTITASNSGGETATAITNPVLESVMVPLTTNIQLSDLSLTPLITWDPVYYNHDNDTATSDILVDGYHIRIYDADTLTTVFRTYAGEGFINPEFLVPEGYLTHGSDYFVRIIANDWANGLENRSSTWDAFSTAPVPEPTTILLLGTGLLCLIRSRKTINR